jgi:hypothetical protein
MRELNTLHRRGGRVEKHRCFTMANFRVRRVEAGIIMGLSGVI